MIGIYKIENLINGKVYIGQSIDIEYRWRTHKMKTECFSNTHLLNAMRKYGLENFSFEILETLPIDDPEMLTLREQHYMDLYNSLNPEKGYNLKEAGSAGRLTEEGLRHLRESHLGKTATEETRRKMSESRKGHQTSSETRQKISKAQKGRILWSDEDKQKMSETRKGRTHTDEARQKMSKTRKGHVISEETRKKISEAHKGMKHTEESKQKISSSKKAANRAKVRFDLLPEDTTRTLSRESSGVPHRGRHHPGSRRGPRLLRVQHVEGYHRRVRPRQYQEDQNPQGLHLGHRYLRQCSHRGGVPGPGHRVRRHHLL